MLPQQVILPQKKTKQSNNELSSNILPGEESTTLSWTAKSFSMSPRKYDKTLVSIVLSPVMPVLVEITEKKLSFVGRKEIKLCMSQVKVRSQSSLCHPKYKNHTFLTMHQPEVSSIQITLVCLWTL